ncbi:MAG: alpha/beta hydrolase, partial [Anaerolineae bacterium]|nr:alpha/beta hydrolase [Anaerolineae bacterium]
LTQVTARRLFRTAEACRWLVERAMAAPASAENVALTHILLHDYNRQRGPGPLPLDELQQVSAPVHLMVSDREIYCDPRRMLNRARRVFARLTVETVTNCGHDINKEQTALVNWRILELLAQTSGVESRP